MIAAYVIAQLHIHDPDAYDLYAKPAIQTVLAFGGEIVIGRNGRRELLEGEGAIPQFIMAKFPSYEQALSWYNSADYAVLINLRRKAASGSILLVEGVGQ